MVTIKASTFSRLGKSPRDLSKKDIERITKGLDPIESEDRAQERIVRYLEQLKEEGKIVRYTAIPNHTRTPYKSVRSKNVRLGVRKGLPDLFIVYRLPGGKAYLSAWLEMKREEGGSATKEQKEWVSVLSKTYGTVAEICKGYDEAVAFIDGLFNP